MPHFRNLKGFTLIELIVVIGIIAVLAAIIILAINPARQFASARNARRNNDVKAFGNALVQYASSNGAYPSGGAGIAACPATTSVTDATFGASGTIGVMVPTYLAAVPTDPKSGNYTVCITTSATQGDRITVNAPGAELGATITYSL